MAHHRVAAAKVLLKMGGQGCLIGPNPRCRIAATCLLPYEGMDH